MLLHHAQTKIKQPLCVCTREQSGGLGWIARAAHLKKPHWGFLPAGLYGGPMLFESTRIRKFHAHTKQKAPT